MHACLEVADGWIFVFHLQPEKGTWEDKTLQVLKNPVDWLSVPEIDLEALSTAELLQEIARRSEK